MNNNRDTVLEFLAAQLVQIKPKLAAINFSFELDLNKDLNVRSIDSVTLALAINSHYEIDLSALSAGFVEMQTIGDVVTFICERLPCG